MSENLVIKQQAGIPVRHQIYRNVVTFLAVTGSLLLLAKLPWVVTYLINPLAFGLTWLVTVFLQLMGEPVYQVGMIVRSALIDLEITPACTGLCHLLVLIAAILAWPARAGERKGGIIFGVFILSSVNIFRIVSIYFTALTIPGWVPFIHGVLWEVVMVLFVPLIWVYWIRSLSTGKNR